MGTSSRLVWLVALAGACSRPAPPAVGDAKIKAEAEGEVSPAPNPQAAQRAGAAKKARATLLLQRLAYGPRLGDIERVALDPDAWLEAQLRPGPPAPSEAARFAELALDHVELERRYPRVPATGRKAGDPSFHELYDLLAAAKLERGLSNERQLEEVLVDFWFNHFNVYASKGDVRWSIVGYEREALRPHVFGSFRELLGATARHPAMLFYLDNWMSSAEREAQGKKKARGLNENYGRELLELHTVGSNGGYDQADVREVALAFTGWSLTKDGAAFHFYPERHAAGARRILGETLDVEGEAQGELVLDRLARHPSTARFVAFKLAQKFVADAPPEALVQRLMGTFLASYGDLGRVYADLFAAPEFAASAESKTKTPLEFVLSALRAVGAEYDGSKRLAKVVEQMGQPLYLAEAPTGYREVASYWVNAGGLIARLNFALALAENSVSGVRFDEARLLGDLRGPVSEWLDRLAARVLAIPPSEATRTTILTTLVHESETRPPDDGLILQRQALGLLLGSPEFQRQ